MPKDIQKHMPKHEITVDEMVGVLDGEPDLHYKAFCSCGWDEDHWHHEDAETDAADVAQQAGNQHLKEVGADA